MYSLESNGPLHARLGRNGRDYFARHYTWPVIEQKYLEMFDRLKRDDATGSPRKRIEAIPGWLARRARTISPANDVLARIPSGAVVPGRESRLEVPQSA